MQTLLSLLAVLALAWGVAFLMMGIQSLGWSLVGLAALILFSIAAANSSSAP